MAGKKKSSKGQKILLVIIMILFFVVLAIYSVFSLRMHRKLSEQKQEQERLQSKIAQLQTDNDELAQKLLDMEAEMMQSLENQEQEDVQQVSVTIDMEHTPSGTVIAAEQVDLANLQQYFCAYEISDEIYQRINGKSYRENPNVGLDDLRYLKVLHYNFDHQYQVGELIVAADLAQDYLGIFQELFQGEYEIYSMHLIDDYWTGNGSTSDSASIDVNNTSAFCYREITGGSNLSNHAYGRAIDINPQQNPYVNYKNGYPMWDHENANDYIDRDTGYEHVITHDDFCYQVFAKYGFSWGGDWETIKDYQHFEKE